MERSCDYCKHKEKPMGVDPCLNCFQPEISKILPSKVNNSSPSLGSYRANFEPVRSCGTCKHVKESICSDVCDTCRIEFGLPNWEEKDE